MWKLRLEKISNSVNHELKWERKLKAKAQITLAWRVKEMTAKHRSGLQHQQSHTAAVQSNDLEAEYFRYSPGM